MIDTLIDDNKMLINRYNAKDITRGKSNQNGITPVVGSVTALLWLRDGSETGISIGARIYI